MPTAVHQGGCDSGGVLQNLSPTDPPGGCLEEGVLVEVWACAEDSGRSGAVVGALSWQ